MSPVFNFPFEKKHKFFHYVYQMEVSVIPIPWEQHYQIQKT